MKGLGCNSTRALAPPLRAKLPLGRVRRCDGHAQQVLLRAQQKLNRMRERQPQAAGLAIARDISHAEAISRVLMDDGNRVELIHSQSPQATERLNAFQSGDADWLVSIDMCAEGFDAPRLRVVAYLTTVVTRSRFVQGTPGLCG